MTFSWRRTFLLGFGFFGISLIWPLFNAFVPIFLRERFGLTAALVGLIMGLDNFINIVVQPTVGSLSDHTRTRFGQRYPFILVGAPLAALGFSLLPLAPTLVLMIAAVLLTNVSMSLFRSPTIALLGDFFPPELRSKANGVINFMGTLGGGLALLVGPILYARNPVLPFHAAAGLMLVAVSILMLTTREPRRAVLSETAVRIRTLAADLTSPLRSADKSLLFILLAILSWSAGYSAIEAFFTSFGKYTLGISEGAAAQSLLFFAGAGLIAAVPAGYIGSWFGRRPTIMVSLAAMAILFSSALLLDSLLHVRLILVLAGAFWTTLIVNALPLVYDAAPPQKVGAATGLYYVVGNLASAVGPFAAGSLVDLTGQNFRMIFLFGPTFMLLALFFLSRVRAGKTLVPAVADPTPAA